MRRWEGPRPCGPLSGIPRPVAFPFPTSRTFRIQPSLQSRPEFIPGDACAGQNSVRLRTGSKIGGRAKPSPKGKSPRKKHFWSKTCSAACISSKYFSALKRTSSRIKYLLFNSDGTLWTHWSKIALYQNAYLYVLCWVSLCRKETKSSSITRSVQWRWNLLLHFE